uniref:Isoform A n=1 Tax=Acartia pacifica TaxID=335913 RepID=A0A0U2V658_ACAPC|nr:isoform A [Acartia pacifica]
MLTVRSIGCLRLLRTLQTPLKDVKFNKVAKFSTSSVKLAEDKPDAPIKFTSSGAYLQSGKLNQEDDYPWYQYPVITISFAAFMIYFCVLREESDIDDKLGGTQTLFERVDGLEIAQIEACIKYNEKNGLSTTKLKLRLLELLEEEEEKKKIAAAAASAVTTN